MDKQKRLKQLEILKSEPNFALFNQISDLNDKLRALNGSVKAQNSKEVINYQNELETLVRGLQSLTDSVNSKDTVVNIPLDQLANQIKAVEVAIKAIKEVKIPEFPSEISISDLQINELLFAIQSIPEFPIDSLKSMVDEFGKKIEKIKLEVPENEFDYDFLSGKFEKLIKAVKNISISVVSGGGGLGDVEKMVLKSIEINTTNPSDLEGGGSVSIGTTAVNLTFTGVTNSVILTANQTNTGIIYIGKSNVTNAGANALTFLMPGESLTLDYNDATNALYAVSDTAAQSLFKGSLL